MTASPAVAFFLSVLLSAYRADLLGSFPGPLPTPLEMQVAAQPNGLTRFGKEGRYFGLR